MTMVAMEYAVILNVALAPRAFWHVITFLSKHINQKRYDGFK